MYNPARVFAQPDRLIFGSETANQAAARFEQAVTDVLARRLHETVVIVAHGTVTRLFVALAAGIAPFPFWQRLGLPSFVVLPRPALAPVTLVGHVS
jgi:broad specificity phosphatase PhoE